MTKKKGYLMNWKQICVFFEGNESVTTCVYLYFNIHYRWHKNERLKNWENKSDTMFLNWQIIIVIIRPNKYWKIITFSINLTVLSHVFFCFSQTFFWKKKNNTSVLHQSIETRSSRPARTFFKLNWFTMFFCH